MGAHRIMSTIENDTQDSRVRSLVRGIKVMTAFGPGRPKLTIAQAAQASGLTRAVARRILLTLQDLGYVQAERGFFYLTARVLDFGQGFLAQPLWEVARPVLLGLANTLNETVSAGVLDGDDVVYAVRIRSSRLVHLELREGARLPAHASSMGRVLLAALPPLERVAFFRRAQLRPYTRHTVTELGVLRQRLDEARKQGWCLVRGEIEESVSGISVPLVDKHEQTIAALNVSIATERASARETKSVIVPALREAARAIAAAL